MMKCSSYCRHESRDCVGGCEGGVSLKKKKKKKKEVRLTQHVHMYRAFFFGDGR